VIRGTSAFALDVVEGYVSSATSDSDQLLLNDISGHTSLIADVYFGMSVHQPVIEAIRGRLAR